MRRLLCGSTPWVPGGCAGGWGIPRQPTACTARRSRRVSAVRSPFRREEWVSWVFSLGVRSGIRRKGTVIGQSHRSAPLHRFLRTISSAPLGDVSFAPFCVVFFAPFCVVFFAPFCVVFSAPFRVVPEPSRSIRIPWTKFIICREILFPGFRAMCSYFLHFVLMERGKEAPDSALLF